MNRHRWVSLFALLLAPMDGGATSDFELTLQNSGAANTVAPVDANARVPTANLGSGTADASKFLRGDQTWAVPAGGAEAFPVGSVFLSVVPTNPGTLLGYGTWTAFGTGRVPVGFDATQTEFDVVEETGGEKTHTLTAAEMPAHTHVQDAHGHTQNSHNHTQDAHTHVQDSHNHTQNAFAPRIINSGTAGTVGVQGASAASNANASNSATTATNQAATATNQNATATNQAATATNQTTVATNQSTGGGGAHNNLQPYIVVYMWKRTA